MEIRQIELFVAAAEEQHFSKAAERCGIVQSGLSSAIRSLEAEMGASLFIRNTRRVELSPAGQAFLPEARRVLLALRDARRSIGQVRAGASGRIVVSMIQSLVPSLDIPRLMHEFRTVYPNVEISVRETRPSDLSLDLRRGTVDLAFIPTYAVNHSGLDVVSVVSSPMAIVGSADHHLVGERDVRFEAIREERFVDLTARWGLRQMVDQVFSAETIYRTTSFEVDDFSLLLQFVERGFGLAMVPRVLIETHRIAALDVTLRNGRFPVWELGMYSARQRDGLPANPVAELFRDAMRRSVEP
ncbi:LysR family transcriptional regulator [Stappia sp. BW2]|uniref:LysR family transcriptional regulator n=1 Tax=Stappia sp. BW2 TaxID=2592622 RepID=UPI001396AA43|nr:LysR family transcriptional regulator [Stappia sp. BW2]